MRGDLIIKDVDLDKLEEDVKRLEEAFGALHWSQNRWLDAGKRVGTMLETWAEGRKAEKEDEAFADELTAELLLNAVESRTEVKAAVLYVLKAQRKRLGK